MFTHEAGGCSIFELVKELVFEHTFTMGTDISNTVRIIVIIIINLPKKKAYTKGKACTRCLPTKTNIHTYTYSTLQVHKKTQNSD